MGRRADHNVTGAKRHKVWYDQILEASSSGSSTPESGARSERHTVVHTTRPAGRDCVLEKRDSRMAGNDAQSSCAPASLGPKTNPNPKAHLNRPAAAVRLRYSQVPQENTPARRRPAQQADTKSQDHAQGDRTHQLRRSSNRPHRDAEGLRDRALMECLRAGCASART